MGNWLEEKKVTAIIIKQQFGFPILSNCDFNVFNLCGQGRFQGFLSLNKVLEIGFGHKIHKLNFVSHLEISQQNCKKKNLLPNIPKKVEKL